jgi:hypothetical protein
VVVLQLALLDQLAWLLQPLHQLVSVLALLDRLAWLLQPLHQLVSVQQPARLRWALLLLLRAVQLQYLLQLEALPQSRLVPLLV